MDERQQLLGLRVHELKQLCKEEGLPSSGRKLELIDRLVEHRQSLLTLQSGFPAARRVNHRSSAAQEEERQLRATKPRRSARFDIGAGDRAAGGPGSSLRCIRCQLVCDARQLTYRVNPKEFWCPMCRLQGMDPFNAVVDSKGVLKFVSCTQPQVDFTMDLQDLRAWKREGLNVEMRMVRIDYHKVAQAWPESMTVVANGEEVFVVHPPEEGHKRRDIPQNITAGLKQGTNMVSMRIQDPNSRGFALAVLLTAPRSTSDLRAQAGRVELHQAISRVRALVNKRSDTEEEDIQCLSSNTLRLMCPITMSRIKEPVRGERCQHLQCFDLDPYIASNQQMRAFNNRWVCPVCTLVLRPHDLRRDLYVERVLSATHESTEEVVVSADSSWKCVAAAVEPSPSPEAAEALDLECSQATLQEAPVQAAVGHERHGVVAEADAAAVGQPNGAVARATPSVPSDATGKVPTLRPIQAYTIAEAVFMTAGAARANGAENSAGAAVPVQIKGKLFPAYFRPHESATYRTNYQASMFGLFVSHAAAALAAAVFSGELGESLADHIPSSFEVAHLSTDGAALLAPGIVHRHSKLGTVESDAEEQEWIDTVEDGPLEQLWLFAKPTLSKRHPLWEGEWWRLEKLQVYMCSVALFAAGLLCSAGGIGGGGIYVTVLMVAGKLTVYDAVPLSKAIVFFGSLSSLVLNLGKSARAITGTGNTKNTLIDYNICRVVVPAALLGTYTGVFLNRVLPSTVILFILTTILIGMTVMVTRTGMRQYYEDHAAQQPTLDAEGNPPLEDPDTESESLNEGSHGQKCGESLRNKLRSSDVTAGAVMLLIVVVCGVIHYHADECHIALLNGLNDAVCTHPAVFFLGGMLETVMGNEVTSWKVGFACASVPIIACTSVLGYTTWQCVKHEGWRCDVAAGYAGMAVVTGCLAGLVGIGGGLIFSPFFLLMGVEPPVAVATSSTCVIFTSSSTSLQYLLTDRVITSLAVIYGVVNLFASYVGTKFVHWLQDTVHAQRSYISGIVALGVFISAVLSAIKMFSGQELH